MTIQSPRKNTTPRKPIVVTRTFLLNVAKMIYDPKTRRHLNLCARVLKNGPDPKDPKRHMHCGLGELYFAMTGKEPERDICDEAVVQMACEQSSLVIKLKANLVGAQQAIKSLKSLKSTMPGDLLEEIINDAVYKIDEYNIDETDEYQDLMRVLNEIPNENDGGGNEPEDEFCNVTHFKERSRRVAAQIRAAAKLLPAD